MIERAELEKTFAKLKAAGFELQVAKSRPDGQGGHNFTIDDIIELQEDPKAFWGGVCEVPFSVIEAWQADPQVYCAGFKKDGTRCRGVVQKGQAGNPKEWQEMQGTFCHTHQK